LKQQEVMRIAPGMSGVLERERYEWYASAGTSLYLDFRFLETRGLHKCAPR